MLHDLRYALRQLHKNAGFSTVVVLTLALGIGANAALFSVVNAVLLKPLPFPDPEQLITIHQSKPNFDSGAMPYPNFLDLQRDNQTLSAIAISRSHSYSLVGMGEAQRVNARLISADYFKVPQVSPYFASVRSAVQTHNNQNVISRVQTLDQVIANSLANRRFSMIVLVSFAALALLLATLGIYGVISYLVGQRTHELGIRLALGAGRNDILRLVLIHGMKMAISGVVVGLIAAFALTRLMSTMLFGIGPTDPTTFVIIAFVLLIVALVACYLPARRATKVDPLNALRTE
jgi:ABC-type antimicrobial peptide transport system permease subunit